MTGKTTDLEKRWQATRTPYASASSWATGELVAKRMECVQLAGAFGIHTTAQPNVDANPNDETTVPEYRW